jgi:hypothetical protein
MTDKKYTFIITCGNCLKRTHLEESLLPEDENRGNIDTLYGRRFLQLKCKCGNEFYDED